MTILTVEINSFKHELLHLFSYSQCTLLNFHSWPSFFFSVTTCSLKREIRKLAQDECGYEEPTVAMAFVYFEKLVLQGKLNKQNRKLCAGACVLLAAKIAGDLKKHEVKLLIDVSLNTPKSLDCSEQSRIKCNISFTANKKNGCRWFTSW